ncbi:MAG TPA: glycosyltransferase family 4 protein [Chthoniobacteraceae bacterium]|nr:glycosyltransferase family 4 protein [Chthoniobacteraceae bacterium]
MKPPAGGLASTDMKTHHKVLMTLDPLGGVWTYGMELTRALGSLGVEVILASMGGPLSDAQRQMVACLPNATLHESVYRLEWMDEPWRDVDKAGEWLLALAERHQPDFIHLNGYVHAALPWQRPVCVVAHSCVCSWWKSLFGTRPPAQFNTYRDRVQEGLSAAHRIIAPSGAMLRALSGLWEIDCGRTGVIWNARDPDRFEPQRKSPVIFAAGRLWDPAKNIELLERIAPDLAWDVIVAGQARSPSGVEPSICNLYRIGSIGPEEMSRQLSRSAIFASPARYEPFGLSVLEAALSGCALVLSDLPTFHELWGDAAVYASPHDPDQWKTALERLISNPFRRQRLGVAARHHALRYAPEAFARGYLDAYRTARAVFETSDASTFPPQAEAPAADHQLSSSL